MPPSLLLLVFNLCLFLTLTNADSTLQLSIYPTSGYSTENIGVRCQINEPSPYENTYLSIKTDNVKPSGILLMVNNADNTCRTNKQEYMHTHSCNSSLILIHVNHIVLNDSLHTIDYECSQGEIAVFNSYRILKDRSTRHYEPKLSNSSSSLTHLFFLLLFNLLLTLKDVRW